jgi:hypothetical protein
MSKWNGQSLRVPNKCSRAQVTLLAEAGQCLNWDTQSENTPCSCVQLAHSRFRYNTGETSQD